MACGQPDRLNLSLLEQLCVMQVTREDQQLLAFLSEVDQRIGCSFGALLVEVDGNVVQNHGKFNPVVRESFHHRQSDCQEQLLTCPTAQFLGGARFTCIIIDVKMLAAERRPQVVVFAQRQFLQERDCCGEHFRLIGLFELSRHIVDSVVGQ